MAKYAVVECNNGNFSVVSEWTDNKEGAFKAWHNRCKILWDAQDCKRAMVKIVDEDLNVVDGKYELIFHADEIPQSETTEPTEDDDAENEPA